MVHFVFAPQRGSTFWIVGWNAMVRQSHRTIPSSSIVLFLINQQIVFGFRAGSARVVIRASILAAVPKFISQIEKRAVEDNKLSSPNTSCRRVNSPIRVKHGSAAETLAWITPLSNLLVAIVFFARCEDRCFVKATHLANATSGWFSGQLSCACRHILKKKDNPKLNIKLCTLSQTQTKKFCANVRFPITVNPRNWSLTFPEFCLVLWWWSFPAAKILGSQRPQSDEKNCSTANMTLK